MLIIIPTVIKKLAKAVYHCSFTDVTNSFTVEHFFNSSKLSLVFSLFLDTFRV